MSHCGRTSNPDVIILMKPLFKLLATCLLCASVQAESLITDKGLSTWEIDVPAADDDVSKRKDTFTIKDGVLRTSGKPLGHIYTEEGYENYKLTIEYRYPEKAGNCGVMLHCSEKRFLDGVFPKSIEVQLMSGKAGDVIAIGEDFMSCFTAPTPGQEGKAKTKYEKRRIEGAEVEIGEWNTMVIVAQGNAILVTVNGQLTTAIVGCSASYGKIALQSEGVPVEFRKLEIEDLGE